MGRATASTLSIMKNVLAQGALIAAWAGTSTRTLWVTTNSTFGMVSLNISAGSYAIETL